MTVSAQERFKTKYTINEETGCWDWKSKSKTLAFSMNGKSLQAHRASYILNIGELEKHQLVVVRSCGNDRCVNPDHMFTETHSQAARRKTFSGKQNVRLTLEEVTEARRLQTAGYRIDDILESFQPVTHPILRKVLTQPERWSKVPSTYVVGSPNNRPRGNFHPISKLDEDTVREIKAMRSGGAKFREIENAFSEINQNTLRSVIYGLSWTHIKI